MRRRSVLSSQVFRRTFGGSALLLFLLLTGLWTLKVVISSGTVNEQKDLIRFQAESMASRFERRGLDAVIEDIAIDGEEIWDPDWLFLALEEEEFIFRLIEGEDETLAGYPGLEADWDWGDAELEHEDLDGHPLVAYRQELDDEHTLIIARFLPQALRDWEEVLVFATLILILILLPLSLITGYFLSRTVFRRLSTIAETAEAVGDGTLDRRVSLRGNGDEFDRLAEALNDMLDRLSALTRNVRNVSVGVAHDLKTPVSNIDGRLQLIERDLDQPEAVREHLERCRGHIARLLRTLDALLRLGEIEAGARRAAFTRVDLSLLADDLLESFEPVLAELDKSLQGDTASGMLVFGDPDLLSQLIINLLENIAEHARDGARAWLQLEGDGDDVLLIVGDDGPGIPSHLRGALFDRFVQADGSRQGGGNGLGLSIVKAIAELHFGSVRLREGTRGAVFEVRIPAKGPKEPYKSV